MRVQLSITLGLLVVTFCGCSRQEPHFSTRQDLDTLIPEAQDHIRNTLDTHFGTATNMVAWERLPIHYHVATGSLTGVDKAGSNEKPGAELTVSLTNQNRPIEPGDMLAFLSGDYVTPKDYEVATVEAFVPETGLLSIEEDGYDPAPAVGDRFVIGPGLILEQGRVLYAEHCQHCHGVSGDGNGPTAKYLNPLPRDYRQGVFKFTSTKTSDRATRDDLKRTIWEGIPGTSMPSFKLLTEKETQSIVEYVLWLAMRGEVEYRQVQTFKADYSKDAVETAVADEVENEDGLSRSAAHEQIIEGLNEYLTEDWSDEFNDDTTFLAEQWKNSWIEEAIVFPTVPRVADTPESRARGRELYMGVTTKCATCHGPQGLGDGGQTLSVQKDTATGAEYPLPGLYDAWGNPLKPRNLTRGIYRGGRRPIDLYRRISAGIKGTQMPPFGTVLKDEQIWDLVNYVMYLPFEARERRPGEGANETLPAPAEVAAHGTSAPVAADTTN